MMKTMTTLDNGGIPFAIASELPFDEKGKKLAALCAQVDWFSYIKMFDGSYHEQGFIQKGGGKTYQSPLGKNSAALFLLQTGTGDEEGRFIYRFVGERAYDFETNESITSFFAPIGNSAVPYPIAVGGEYIYFMLDKVRVHRDLFEGEINWAEAYQYFYGHKPAFQAFTEDEKEPFKNVIDITDRVLHPEPRDPQSIMDEALEEIAQYSVRTANAMVNDSTDKLKDLIHGLVSEGNFKSEKAIYFKKEAERIIDIAETVG